MPICIPFSISEKLQFENQIVIFKSIMIRNKKDYQNDSLFLNMINGKIFLSTEFTMFYSDNKVVLKINFNYKISNHSFFDRLLKKEASVLIKS